MIEWLWIPAAPFLSMCNRGSVVPVNGFQTHHINIGEVPCVFEFCSFSRRPDRCGIVRVGIKRRVKIDQIHAPRVQPAHDVEVIARPYRAVKKLISPS